MQPAHTGRRFLSLSGVAMTDRNVLFLIIHGGLRVTAVCQTAGEMQVLLLLPAAHTQTWTVTPLRAHPGWDRVAALPFLPLCGSGQQLEVKADSCLDADFLWLETSSCSTPKRILPPRCKYGTRLVNKNDGLNRSAATRSCLRSWNPQITTFIVVLFFMGKDFCSQQIWVMWPENCVGVIALLPFSRTDRHPAEQCLTLNKTRRGRHDVNDSFGQSQRRESAAKPSKHDDKGVHGVCWEGVGISQIKSQIYTFPGEMDDYLDG